MAQISRRNALGAGAGIAAATALGAAAPAAADAEPAPSPASPGEGRHPHLFSLAKSAPATYHGGTLRGATEHTFPVLSGQQGSVYLIHLDPGGVREPHWHPTAWELNYVLSGRAEWSILGTHPDGSYHNDVFTAEQGELVFAPQGFFHYFANPSDTEGLDVLALFNTSAAEPNDDIGIVGTLNSLPREILAASFGIPVSAFDRVPRDLKPVVITRRP
ncbi:cupin domain-containing protein [Amycolatopsis sp. PS_44_ISF1]|uniref:cupin domain-containing protein n=1 Tax=Amycolatopsis sp. PS_44_ISF1 TaxID=2974917 RepID=UPI0028DF04F0|nr:cupin domain-containing protein [Amycolatopsis sp. PS_44_ISF1]MDT8914099.1 cupin domain-containing protein [Amycolatopsis sp. PS_44_ISF1]